MLGLTRQQATANAITMGELRSLLLAVAGEVSAPPAPFVSADAELQFMTPALTAAGRPDVVQDYRSLLFEGQDDALPLRWSEFEPRFRRALAQGVAI